MERITANPLSSAQLFRRHLPHGRCRRLIFPLFVWPSEKNFVSLRKNCERTLAENVKLLPSGISDFKQLRRQNRYYVDKSMYIPTIEEVSNFLFLIRPRRFGKSLFLTMLAAYYNLNGQEEFRHCYPEHLTQLHLIVVQLRVYDIERMEEIVSPIVAGRPLF